MNEPYETKTYAQQIEPRPDRPNRHAGATNAYRVVVAAKVGCLTLCCGAPVGDASHKAWFLLGALGLPPIGGSEVAG